MSNCTYSIIIPHKNIPELLSRCLKTIPRREDIQIIVVDDNSDANKVDFKHFPGFGESCVEIYFTKEGKGAGYARNIGLNYARGKWLLFADADDYFTENFLSYLDKYKDSNNDIVFFGTTSIYPETGETAMRHLPLQKMLHNAIKTGNYEEMRYKRYSPVSKMIKKSLVDENLILFDEVMASNDAMFAVKTNHLASSISLDTNVLYVITVRKGSIEYSISETSVRCRLEVAKRINEYLSANRISERADLLEHILQFRNISTSVFVKELLAYILMNPISGIGDLFKRLYNCLCRLSKEKTAMKKNESYISRN